MGAIWGNLMNAKKKKTHHCGGFSHSIMMMERFWLNLLMMMLLVCEEDWSVSEEFSVDGFLCDGLWIFGFLMFFGCHACRGFFNA